MQWLKTWLRKWLGIDEVRDLLINISRNDRDTVRDVTDRLVLRVGELADRVENLREHYASVKEMGEACMARLDRETMKLAAAINDNRDAVRTELLEVVTLGERDEKRISELETIVKDGTIETALAELEDRVAKIENLPVPSSTQPQGRRGGSAWASHQVAASAGAARANGMPEVPIPVPGVS